MIIKQGAQDEKAFSIATGEIYVVIETSKGLISLIKLNKKDVFGHVPFIDIGHEPRLASILGSGDLEIRSIDTDKLQKEHANLSRTFKHLIEHSCNSISVTTGLIRELLD